MTQVVGATTGEEGILTACFQAIPSLPSSLHLSAPPQWSTNYSAAVGAAVSSRWSIADSWSNSHSSPNQFARFLSLKASRRTDGDGAVNEGGRNIRVARVPCST